MTNTLRALWSQPRFPNPPARSRRDWLLVAVAGSAVIIEGTFRPDVAWRPLVTAVAVALAFTLPWRRTQPMVVVVVAFGTVAVTDAASFVLGAAPVGLDAQVYVLLLAYSLFRWGSGREAVVGLVAMLATYTLNITVITNEVQGVGHAVAALAFLLFPAALGASVRFRANTRFREMIQVKLAEREQLARELHDTVAHHVSSIAIQAQAGRTLAPSDPQAAVEALTVIEEESSRTLADMRLMVGVLRAGEEPSLAPAPRLGDIQRLAEAGRDSLPVEVRLSGDLGDLPPAVEAAICRIAQESITNARRHARHATAVVVSIAGTDDRVQVTVSDDGGRRLAGGRSSSGYGLVGMRERASLHGGTLEAGPGPDGGWIVTASVPLRGTLG
ncbi:MAG: sensor histidine kinase [Acidimicrobiales bacterium]